MATASHNVQKLHHGLRDCLDESPEVYIVSDSSKIMARLTAVRPANGARTDFRAGLPSRESMGRGVSRIMTWAKFPLRCKLKLTASTSTVWSPHQAFAGLLLLTETLTSIRKYDNFQKDKIMSRTRGGAPLRAAGVFVQQLVEIMEFREQCHVYLVWLQRQRTLPQTGRHRVNSNVPRISRPKNFLRETYDPKGTCQSLGMSIFKCHGHKHPKFQLLRQVPQPVSHAQAYRSVAVCGSKFFGEYKNTSTPTPSPWETLGQLSEAFSTLTRRCSVLEVDI
jgi:hypothetical protein